MQIRPFASLALAALASAPMFSSTAQAVALGNVASQSSIGQPLRVVIPVALVDGETLNTACLRLVSDGSQDGTPQLPAGRINFDRSGSSPRIVVTTARPISEPALKFSVQAGCGSTVRRDYALLFDLPELERRAPIASANADEFAQYIRGHRPVAVASVRRAQVRAPASAPPAPVLAAIDHSKFVERPAKPAPALAAPEPAAPRELVAFVTNTGPGGLISDAGAQSLPRVGVPPSRQKALSESTTTSIWDHTWPYTAGGFGVLVMGLTAFSFRRRVSHPAWTLSASHGEPMHASSQAAPPVTFAHFGVMTEPAPITPPRASYDFPQLADIPTTEDDSLDTLLGDIASEVIDERAVREAWKKAASETPTDLGTDSILKAIAAAERDLHIGAPEPAQAAMDIALEDELSREVPPRK